MSFLTDQLHTIGETFDEIAGVEARLVRGSLEIPITCVPVKKPPAYLSDQAALAADLQDFYLFRKQLGNFYPKMDDRIVLGTETYQLTSIVRYREVIPPVEPLSSDADRLVAHTVRIKK
jgi:hypothetical protein